MKIFVISLRAAEVRRADATRQMANYGLSFEFLDAVEGRETCIFDWFSEFDRWRYRFNTRRHDPTPGELGCYASHLSLWQWSIDHDEPVIILEDDFLLEPGFAGLTSELEPLIDRFGFIRLQSMSGPRAPLKRLRPPACEVFRRNSLSIHYLSDPPLYALAYAIGPRAARTMVQASSTLFAPVDKFFQHTWIHKTPIYVVDPPVVRMSPQAELSTIGDRTNKSIDPRILLGRVIYKGAGEFRRYGYDREFFAEASRADSVATSE